MTEEKRIVITQEIFDRLSADQQAVLRACLAAEEAASAQVSWGNRKIIPNRLNIPLNEYDIPTPSTPPN
ncbi:MAG: hypothetical protein QF372_05330, partial [Candidatus Poseidoniia archaeon]|nr:hypothetical protein [Candidatus Poseidoniia archaeon]